MKLDLPHLNRFRVMHVCYVFAMWLASALATMAHAGLEYQSLVSLNGFSSGFQPYGPLLERSDGWPSYARSFYGTSRFGGTNSAGTVFRLTLIGDGKFLDVIHHFGNEPTDGRNPSGGLVEADDGKLYGITESGGNNNAGTIFRLNKDGTEYSVVHRFEADGVDGNKPLAGLLKGSDGALYGTTFSGNFHNAVFKITTNGTYSALYESDVGSLSALVEGTDGTLYGASWSGGSNGVGAVFKLNKDGSDYSVLHHFVGNLNGGHWEFPTGLILASDGALYGTTYYGGGDGVGSIFKLNTNGSGFDVLHSFTTNAVDGQYPTSVLLEASDGMLYGNTYGDDLVAGAGDTVFRINKGGGGFEILHRFGSSSGDGRFPAAGLIQAGDRALYGTTTVGGAFDSGTVFRVMDFVPPVLSIGVSNQFPALQIAGTPGWRYRLEYTPELSANNWTELVTFTLLTNRLTIVDITANGTIPRFYRVALLTAPCPGGSPNRYNIGFTVSPYTSAEQRIQEVAAKTAALIAEFGHGLFNVSSYSFLPVLVATIPDPNLVLAITQAPDIVGVSPQDCAVGGAND